MVWPISDTQNCNPAWAPGLAHLAGWCSMKGGFSTITLRVRAESGDCPHPHFPACLSGLLPLKDREISLLAAGSVQFSHSVVSDSLRPHELQHARPPCPSPTPGVYPNSCPLSQWCHPTISSSVVPFSSCIQPFPASWSFQMNQFFTSGGKSIGVSASISVLRMNTQDWSPSEWTGWISLQSKGLSRVFSNTTVQKHQFFGAQLSLQSNSHIQTDYWKNHSLD